MNSTPSSADREKILRECAPKRISSYGSNPWAIVHEPSGSHVTGPAEVLDYGLGYRPIMGPRYFRRKRDAQAALDALRKLCSAVSGNTTEQGP